MIPISLCNEFESVSVCLQTGENLKLAFTYFGKRNCSRFCPSGFGSPANQIQCLRQYIYLKYKRSIRVSGDIADQIGQCHLNGNRFVPVTCRQSNCFCIVIVLQSFQLDRVEYRCFLIRPYLQRLQSYIIRQFQNNIERSLVLQLRVRRQNKGRGYFIFHTDQYVYLFCQGKLVFTVQSHLYHIQTGNCRYRNRYFPIQFIRRSVHFYPLV